MRAPDAFRAYPDLRRWISLDTNQKIAVRTGKVEIGQGILTALRQVVADELCVDIGRVEMQAASTALGPDEGYTVGSLSVEQSGPTMQYLGALMRERLLQVARETHFGANEALSVQDGVVFLNDQKTDISYWSKATQLIEAKVNPDEEVGGLAPSLYKYVGKSSARVDLQAKIQGGAFIQDMELPSLQHGRVLRRPFAAARVGKIDLARLEKRFPDTRWVVRNEFIGCVADTEMQANLSHAALETAVDWTGDLPEGTQVTEMAAWLRQLPLVEHRPVVQPDMPAVTSDQTYSGAWTRPFIAHASIGLSTALAWVRDGILEIWSHSQGIFFLREQIARVLERPLDTVQIHHVAGSGCYGHNAADDVALDAALLALSCPGMPIRVQWNRKDELRHGPFGAAGIAELKVGTGQDGRIVSWETHILGTSHGARPGMHGEPNLLAAPAIDPRWADTVIADTPESNGGGASRNARPIYDVGDYALSLSLVRPPFRSSALRALGAHLNVVSIEGMMDDIARAQGQQPIAFRRNHLSDPRAIAVLNNAVEMSGWAGNFGAVGDYHYGFGLGRYKGRGSYCAVVAEIELSETVQVRRVWCAVDAGNVINPDGAINQIEGGIIQSLSWTVLEAVPIVGDEPAIEGWESYPILRFDQIPTISTVLLNSHERPTGTGEVAQGPMAAAICNAVSDAIGIRARDMPLTRERLMSLIAEA